MEHDIPAEDVAAFLDTARGELLDLHKGSVTQHGFATRAARVNPKGLWVVGITPVLTCKPERQP